MIESYRFVGYRYNLFKVRTYVFAYLLMFCKFCPCVVILALKYRIYGNTKSNFVVILSKPDGKEIPDLQVLSFE